MTDPLQELLAAGRRPDDDVPADEPLRGVGVDALGSGRRRAAGAVPAPALLPAPGALRAALRGRASSRATGATCSRARHLGDPELCWRLADANGVDRPARADRRRSAGALRITLPEGVPGAPMPERRPPAAADRARACRCRRRARWSTRCRQVKVESGSGETQSGFELDLPALEPLAAAHALPAHRRREHPDRPRRDRGHDQRHDEVLIDGVMTHHEVQLATAARRRRWSSRART